MLHAHTIPHNYLFKKSIQCVDIHRLMSHWPFIHFNHFFRLNLRRLTTTVSTVIGSIICRCIWCNWRWRWMWRIIDIKSSVCSSSSSSSSIRCIINSVVIIIIRVDSSDVCARIVSWSRSRSRRCICRCGIDIVRRQISSIIAGWMILPTIDAA